MKIRFATLLIFFTGSCLFSQEYKIPVQNSAEERLVLKNFNGELPIEGYSGNEIIITSASDHNSPPEKAKGLKPIYPSGTDNTGIGLEVQKNGSRIMVTCLLPFAVEGEFKIRVPENLSLEVESDCERGNNVIIGNMKSEIEIKNCQGIDLKDVCGPLVLSTISGDINVTFSKINSDKPFSVNSISGDINITLPVKTPADISLTTINGGLYSDFDYTETQKDLKKIGGNTVNFAINGGGLKFSISNVTGNIYLRKGK